MSSPPGVSATYWAWLTAEPLGAQSVLDVGTGSGRIALGLAPLARRVVGVDRDADAIAAARRRAAAAGAGNAEFVVADVEAIDYTLFHPDTVVAHLCMSDAIVERAARALAPGRLFAFVAFHTDQWCETGRASRFAYDEARAGRVVREAGFTLESLEVERTVQRFGSVEEALAAAVGLEERWRADGRWFQYVKFLEQGGRTLTQSHLLVKARRERA